MNWRKSLGFKIYYKDNNIYAVTKKFINLPFIINDKLSFNFINGIENPSEYQVFNIDDMIYIHNIDKLDFISTNNNLRQPKNDPTSNSIKITLYELTNTLTIELTDKHKEYIIRNDNDFKIIGQTDEEHLIINEKIKIKELTENKKIIFENINVKNIDKLLCSNCSLNVFVHKTKKGKLLEINALIDLENMYPLSNNADVEIQIYNNKNQYSVSIILKNKISPNFDISNWIIGFVDKFDKNKLYHWITIPIDILLEKNEYHTGFILNKKIKNCSLIGRCVFENVGVVWK